MGDAGSVLVNDDELYHKIYQIHDHGVHLDGEVKRWGRNSRLDNIWAAILSYKLKSYENVIQRRRQVATLYHEKLSELEELVLPPAPNSDPNHFDVYQNYELEAKNRDDLKSFYIKIISERLFNGVEWRSISSNNLVLIKHYQKLNSFLKIVLCCQ